jgi:uncharacterized protein (DUF2141 family)
MKYLFPLIGLFILTSSQKTYELEVTVTNIQNSKGEVHVAIFRKQDNFPDYGKQFKGIITKAEKGKVTVTFKNLPSNEYALAAFHDENRNGKMDKSIVGAPTEDYGFSNDARRVFSAPSFEEAKFELGKDKKLSFKLD